MITIGGTRVFSPINTEVNFMLALRYIAAQSLLLAQKVLGQMQNLDIDTLTIFSQSDKEFDFISGYIKRFGEESPFTHGETLYISSNVKVDGHSIKFLGVRQPDLTRKEVGYADYPAENYDELVQSNIRNKYTVEIISGRNQKLLELKHPEFDVRGYVVPMDMHDDHMDRPELTVL